MVTPWHWLNVVLCILVDHPRGRYETQHENRGRLYSKNCARCRHPVEHWRETAREASEADVTARPASPARRINGLTSGENLGNELGLR